MMSEKDKQDNPSKPLEPVFVDQFDVDKDEQEGEILVGPDGRPILGPDGRPLRRRKRKKKRSAKDISIWVALVGVAIGALLVGYWQLSTSAGSRGTPVEAFSTLPGWQFTLTNPRPGQTLERCFTISAGGLSPMYMKMYLKNEPEAYETTYAMQITRGKQATSDSSCRGFRPDKKSYIGLGAGIIFQDVSTGLTTDPSLGLIEPTLSQKVAWSKGDSHSYRVRLIVLNNKAPRGLKASVVFEPRQIDQLGRSDEVFVGNRTPRLPSGNPRCKRLLNLTRDSRGYWMSASLLSSQAFGAQAHLIPAGDQGLKLVLSSLRQKETEQLKRLTPLVTSYGRPINVTRADGETIIPPSALESGTNDLRVKVGSATAQFQPALVIDEFEACKEAND